MFQGAFTAMITPFLNGQVDVPALRSFVDWQIEQGISGLVPVGTTGESPTLSHTEHKMVVEEVVRHVNGRVPVVAGAGSNSTEEAVDFARHAESAGAQAILVVTPYYNKPTQEGLYQHYKAINDAVKTPIFIYNIPPRSVIDMSVETMARLFALDNIIGVKDATADMTRPGRQRLACGPDFVQLSGEDASQIGFNAQGGVGVISVVSNVAPKLVSDLQKATQRGEYRDALAINDKLIKLHSALFVEANPAPVKYALSLLGKCSDAVRLPLVPLSEGNRGVVRDALVHAGLI